MKNYTKEQAKTTIITSLKADRTNALTRLVSSAIFAAYNAGEAKKGLQDIYISQGFTRVVKGNIYHSQQADIDIKAAIKLNDLHGKELLAFIPDATNEKDLLNKAVSFVSLKYAPANLPLKINNKFLPMLTEGWTLEQAQEAQNGRLEEGNNPTGTNNDEGEAEAIGNSGTDNAELTEGKEKKTKSMLFNEHSKAIIEALKSLKNNDKPLLLEALHFIETITRASLLALDVHSLVNAKGEKVELVQGDSLAIDIISQKLKLSMQSVDAVSKPEITVKEKGKRNKKVMVNDMLIKQISENNPNFKAA